MYTGNDLVFQQGSAPAHCAAHVQQLNCCVKKRQTFSRPTCGLQAVDYEIWAVIQHRICHKQIHSVDELKRRLDVWCALEQSTFDEAIDQWRRRHPACVHDKAGHFENSLWTDNADFVTSVTFNVTCLTVTSLIAKSCQQGWPMHSCSFYKVVH